MTQIRENILKRALLNNAQIVLPEINDERVKHELYLSTVEVTSSPLMNTNETYKEMSSILNKVRYEENS